MTDDASGGVPETQEEPGASPPLRERLTWAALRPHAPWLVFLGWGFVVLLVAVARIDPWNKARAWRRWFRQDQRGWELLIPGLLLGLAAWIVVQAHDRWSDEGWSPEVVAMLAVGLGSLIGAALWGLHALDLRPFSV